MDDYDDHAPSANHTTSIVQRYMSIKSLRGGKRVSGATPTLRSQPLPTHRKTLRGDDRGHAPVIVPHTRVVQPHITKPASREADAMEVDVSTTHYTTNNTRTQPNGVYDQSSPLTKNTADTRRNLTFERITKHAFSDTWVSGRKVSDFATKSPFADVSCRGCNPPKPMTRCHSPKNGGYWWACSGDFRKPGDQCKSTVSDDTMQQYLDGILYSPWSSLTTNDPHPGYHRTIVSPHALFFQTVLHPPVIPGNSKQGRIAAIAEFRPSPLESWFDQYYGAITRAQRTPPFIKYSQCVDYTIQLTNDAYAPQVGNIPCPTRQASLWIYYHAQCRTDPVLAQTLRAPNARDDEDKEEDYVCSIPVHGLSTGDDFAGYGAHISGWLFYPHAAEWIMVHLPPRSSECFNLAMADIVAPSQTLQPTTIVDGDVTTRALPEAKSAHVIDSNHVYFCRRQHLATYITTKYGLDVTQVGSGDPAKSDDALYEHISNTPGVMVTPWWNGQSSLRDIVNNVGLPVPCTTEKPHARHNRALHVMITRREWIDLCEPLPVPTSSM